MRHSQKNYDAATTELTILVGRKKKAFKVHRTILIEKSKHFKACLSRAGYVEATQAFVHLSQLRCAGVENVLHWIYGGGILSNFYIIQHLGAKTTLDFIKAASYLVIPELLEAIGTAVLEDILEPPNLYDKSFESETEAPESDSHLMHEKARLKVLNLLYHEGWSAPGEAWGEFYSQISQWGSHWCETHAVAIRSFAEEEQLVSSLLLDMITSRWDAYGFIIESY